MRGYLYFSAWLLAGLCVSAPAAGDEPFPYAATINTDDVYVRSGPGKNFYPTDKLPQGIEVEVWRHDPGGWLAVRPPDGSFSWVSARHVQLLEQNMAVVEGDKVAARVGAAFSDVRDVIQVRLDGGETVQVLGGKRFPGDRQTWYKIAPPAGEFRWVAAKDVDRPESAPPIDEELSETPDWAVDSSGGEAEFADNEEPAGDLEALATEAEEAEAAEEQPHAEPPVRLAGAERSSPEDQGLDAEPETVEPDDASPVEKPAGGWTVARERFEAEPRPVAVPQKTFQTQGTFQGRLDDIDLELSVMVAEEPSVWSLDELLQRAEALADRAESSMERRQAGALLDKIVRFQRIYERYSTVANIQDETDRANAELASSVEPAVAISPAATVSADPMQGFDGFGRLTQVVSQRVGAPTFALVDTTGAVQSYVTPAPGVNLTPYIGREIGVSGQRGFLTELNKPHVTVAHITARN